MQKICLIYTSVGSLNEAQRIADDLVCGHIAACVQISDSGVSVYRWQGHVEQSHEYYLTIKTTPEHCRAVVDWLDQHHPYTLPEIIWSEHHASDAYADWVASVTNTQAA